MDPFAVRWYERRTSQAGDWPLDRLRAAKARTTVAVVVPARDEESTVGGVVRCVRTLAARTGLVDEIVVMDSGSTDRTASVAAAAGARVVRREDVLPELGIRPGKGEVLWKSLAATRSDLLVFLDADLTSIGPRFVTGLLGPLLTDPDVALVKAFYERPLAGAGAGAGGRVTELVARPLLNLHFPALAGVIQPLSGEYAARRRLLERLPFAAGYGVEIGLLVDTVRMAGLHAIAQVDLGRREHRHQDHLALGRMAFEIHQTVLSRMPGGHAVPTRLTQFQRDPSGSYQPQTHELPIAERPPMLSIPAYARRQAAVS